LLKTREYNVKNISRKKKEKEGKNINKKQYGENNGINMEEIE
tara:strand:- start:211 stop:336 length:126 start_codon:yes stop_codon:yes gene_type:complete